MRVRELINNKHRKQLGTKLQKYNQSVFVPNAYTYYSDVNHATSLRLFFNNFSRLTTRVSVASLPTALLAVD